MHTNSLQDKAVLITGGTRGIGLATGLAFGQHGAICTLTHRWGSADEEEIRRLFELAGAPAPYIVEADASNEDDTTALLEEMHRRHERIEIFISSVSLALIVRNFTSYQKRSLVKSMDYTTWPLFGYTQRIKKVFGHYPRYIIGLSSDGPEYYCTNYDYVAACKATMETLARYAAHRLAAEDVHLNVVRAGYVLTESLRATFGEEFANFAERTHLDRQMITAEEVAGVILALCSGLLDGVNGQVVMADRGLSFSGNLMRLYNERDVIDMNFQEKL